MDVPEYKIPDYIEVDENTVISTEGIMSIKQDFDGSVVVKYISGYTETVSTMSMTALLEKLGRNPLTRGPADSA